MFSTEYGQHQHLLHLHNLLVLLRLLLFWLLLLSTARKLGSPLLKVSYIYSVVPGYSKLPCNYCTSVIILFSCNYLVNNLLDYGWFLGSPGTLCCIPQEYWSVPSEQTGEQCNNNNHQHSGIIRRMVPDSPQNYGAFKYPGHGTFNILILS